MKKIFLVVVILITTYILIIFKLPELGASLGNLLGTTKINNFLLQNSNTFNNIVTDIPTKDELINTYKKTYSGAIELKKNVINGAESIKSTIDDIRVTLSGAENKINEVKEKYDQAKDFIDTNSGKIKEIQETIEKVSEIQEKLTNTGETN